MPRPRPAAVALVTSQPVVVLTPERQKLADAIATIAAMEANIAKTTAAINNAEDEWTAASAALHAAEQVLERAKPRLSGFTPMPQQPGAFWGSETDYLANEAEQNTPPIPIADARDALSRAIDARDSATRLVQFHKDRLSRLQQDLQWRGSAVRDAARVVIRSDPALMALAAESRRLATRAAAAAMAFEVATGGDVIQLGSPFYGCKEPSSFRNDPEGWALSRAWREALERLQNDATTQLPMPEAS